jgi:hypothetical protein
MQAKSKRVTLKSLREDLAQERARRIADAVEYKQAIAARDRQIADAESVMRRAHNELANAGKYFTHLQTSLALLNQVSEQAGRCAAHFANAYRLPKEPEER